MDTRESFSDLIYADELHAAEGELSAFIGAGTHANAWVRRLRLIFPCFKNRPDSISLTDA